MVEGTPLLRAQMVKSCLEGSNPFLSATYPHLQVDCLGPHLVAAGRSLGGHLSYVTSDFDDHYL